MSDLNLDAGECNITLRRGDDWTIRFELFDANNDQITDLPEEGWESQIRVSKDADETVDSISVDSSNIADGYVELTFPILDHGSYWYDAQYPSGEGVRTPFGGKLTVVRDVTRDDD